MSVPDPLGRDRLAAGAAIYRPPVYGQKPPPKPFYRRPWGIAVLAAVALAASSVVYRATSSAEDSPEAAATRVIELFLAEDYGELRRALCREDRGQVGTNDLESAGASGAALIKALDDPVIESVAAVKLLGSYADVQAQQVTGRITGLGGGTTFRLVTVQERGGWRVCLSPGGYALGALNLDVPIGGDLQAPS